MNQHSYSVFYQFILKVITGLIVFSINWAAADQSINDVELYYSLGGQFASSKPATSLSHLESLDANLNFGGAICGSFDPALDVTDLLTSHLQESMAALSSFPQQIIGALPGYILCRAQPGMCQLLQHYVVRAENNWNLAIDSCESVFNSATSENSLHGEWLNVAKVQEWQRQAQTGVNAVQAKQAVDETDGCVTWVGGAEAGCAGKNPIWPTKDTIEAGWCLIQNKPAKCSATGISNNFRNYSSLHRIWPKPELASEWVTDVVGDHKIEAGVSPSSKAGIGLLPKIEEQTKSIKENLAQIVYSSTPPSESDMEGVGGTHFFITTEIIEALRDLPDRDYLIDRLSNEIALSHVIERAFLARRLLLSGLLEPNIQATSASTEVVTEKVNLIEREIERSLYEMQLSRQLISSTAGRILDAHRKFTTPSSPARTHYNKYLE